MKALFLLLALVGTAVAAEPAHPVIPTRTFLLKDYNPAADGNTPATEAFRRALSVCARAGGGTLVVPAGRYLTGPLDLCSNLNLRLEAGAVILFIQDFTAYEVEDQKPRPLLQAVHCHDVMISGAGTIDGQGQPWWEKQRKFTTGARTLGDKGDAEIPRPRMVVFDQCERVRLEGVTLTNSPSFHLLPEQCKDVTIDGVTILAPEDSPNTDGIDPSGSSRVLITRCRIDVGDDCIAIKAGHLNAGPCRDVTVTDCTFLHGHGLSIGSETTEGVRNLTVSRCTFEGTEIGIRLKSERGRGGLVENLSYSDITMQKVGQATERLIRLVNDLLSLSRIESGRLQFVERQSTRGKVPRCFAIDPTGQYLIAANQGSDSIVIFRINAQTGRLIWTGQTATHRPQPTQLGRPYSATKPRCL